VNDWAPLARALTVRLVRTPSVNGTRDEAQFAPLLRDLLAEWPYFRQHPDHLWLEAVPDDVLGRQNVLALVRGEASRTVVLSGHFDVVDTTSYGEARAIATEPEQLRHHLLTRLRQLPQDLDAGQARMDLESGAFLPGRGMLDMKSGLGAALAVLSRFAELPRRPGSLLLVATPDEENASLGMRAAAPRLADMARHHGLTLEAGINLDATADPGEGAAGPVVALGGVGKLLLSALTVGRETHACYPQLGVNAAVLAAQLVLAFEGAPELTDHADGEAGPPPATLGTRDLKPGYDVTTPGRAWSIWNVITQRMTSSEVLRRASEVARRNLAGGVQLLTFAELRAAAFRRGGAALVQGWQEQAVQVAGQDLDLPEQSRALTEFLWDASGLGGPAVVLGFASLPYPAVSPGTDPRSQQLHRVVRRAAREVSALLDIPIPVHRYLPVISDMSFLAPIDVAELHVTAANTPPWDAGVRWNLDQAGHLRLPMVNIGPWGRGYHGWLERVNVRYAFEGLPELIWRAVLGVLEEE